jgi:glycosyltransferase involved in cell wall biosynthesis
MISQNFYPELGSAGNRIKNIFKLLKKEKYDVTVLTTEPSYPSRAIYEDEQFWDDDSIRKDDADVKRITVRNRKYSSSIMNRLLFYLEITSKILRTIRKDRNKYDVIFVTSPAIFIAFAGLFAKYRFKCRLILDIRDLWPETLKGVGVFNYPLILSFFSLLEKILYKKADHIIVNSMGFIDFIVNRGISREKISFMPNSAMKGELAQKPAGEGEFSVIYAGNIGLAQDIQLLKDLAKQLNEHNIQLTIMGYGFNKQELIQYIEENHLSNVRFFKPVTRKNSLEIISSHHIGLVVLNDKKVFETVLPGKIVDYMTCGIPIVASVSGYSKDVLEKQEVGLVSESHSVENVVQHILTLSKDPQLRARFSQNALQYVQQHFLWEHNIRILTSVIENKMSVNKVSNEADSIEKVDEL